MKLALILVASLALTGVSLVATADTAAAAAPCQVRLVDTGAHVDTIFGPVPLYAPRVECDL